MSITQESGIYFFSDSKCLYRDGSSCVASSGTLTQNNILNFNKSFTWSSSGSSDSKTETLTITFATAQTIDSLFLINHNFRNFDITYNGNNNFSNVQQVPFYNYDDFFGNYTDESGNEYVDESGNNYYDPVDTGVNSEFDIRTSEINILDNNKNTSYFEFNPVSVTSITIKAYNTQIANQQKTLAIFSAQSKIGNFSNAGLDKTDPAIDSNIRSYNNILNKPFIRKGIDTFSASIRIPYADNQNDVDLYETLQDLEESFIIWLCGGKYGNDYFSVEAKPYRLQDVYRVQNTRASNPSFYQNLYISGYINGLNVVEVA